MKNIILILSILFIASCGSDNNPTSSNQTKGQITYKVTLYDQYENKLENQTGLVGQIFEDDKLIQTAYSDNNGLIVFQNINAGVYNFKFFKEGFVKSYYTKDTTVYENIQFVGAGNYKIATQDYYSKDLFDTSYWAIPNLSYEIVKNRTPSRLAI
jgi:hypothetical protein